MSDYRVIAAATATLQNLLADAIRETVPGAGVATGQPPAKSDHELTEGLINIFVYKAEPNPTWRNEELPYRRSDGTLSRRPRLALDLYFLISFYGDDSKQIPNLLLGAALSALHAEPYPPSRHVPQASAADEGGFAAVAGGPDLAGSGLLTQDHPLSFTLLSTEEDEVIQTWTRLMHSAYVLSIAYVGRVVELESDLVPEPSLPARRMAFHLHGAHQPRLEALEPASLDWAAGTELRLAGANLGAEHVAVSIGEIEVEPLTRSEAELRVLLPAGVQAGSHLVRVVHGRQRGGVVRWDVASNPLAAVVRPVVLDAGWHWRPAQDTAESADTGDGSPVVLQVRFAPPVSVATSVDLLLNASPTPAEPTARRGYVFRGTAAPLQPDRLEIPATVAPGRYLVRVRIHGVDSPLRVDEEPESPTFERYVGPMIEVPGEH